MGTDRIIESCAYESHNSIQLNFLIQFLFKVNTFRNVTNTISFKLLHRLNFRNNTKIIALYN